ncbi:biotin carboxylase N-terminal domain-containing protein [Shouchella lehensis]|uniref:biotin carboxylase n=1 Tax=Shouchella lehensis TaxID=300825 RepID=A0A4Y7WHX7_9BACI|nr:biotin carboxylase N-terminal domain-containing protein [Shouchella lehensis]MBG9785511.1 biotin carboxylase [Shouchella lehensis]TES47949.1 ATP-grasp domain-containing protein [Shouchella lehensis]
MIQSILIANRGEIASRIIRTCKKMKIRTVAIYSEADRDAEHTVLADEAYMVGESNVKESYLNQDRILLIAKEANVDAIHPGYGLLSEQAAFAEKCQSHGFRFIGPDASIISLMGDKLQARKTMMEAGVPVIPGTDAVETIEDTLFEANNIGYPVMLKAASGGGGIGITICRSDDDCQKAFEKNKKQAALFFGDGALYIEKYIENPRHIELQVLADGKGRTLVFGERECSVQRRHQKIIEEAPSPFLKDVGRQEMINMALKAAQAIHYQNAGTIECLVDEDGMFYFLEMNTRLQVEHPVTEEIYKLDLVEWQIRIASGDTLPWKQEELTPTGHAIEARIYAEDPIRFFPSPGTVEKIELPEAPHIRHECPIKAGSVISHFYDPMIAKLIVHGTNRDDAIAKLENALNHYTVTGIKTNIPALKAIVHHPVFQQGGATTAFMDTYRDELIKRIQEVNQ